MRAHTCRAHAPAVLKTPLDSVAEDAPEVPWALLSGTSTGFSRVVRRGLGDSHSPVLIDVRVDPSAGFEFTEDRLLEHRTGASFVRASSAPPNSSLFSGRKIGRIADSAARRGRLITTTGRKTILVAEDDTSVRDLILTTLRRHGFSALSAADGRAAMQLIEVDRRRIDLLVSDVVMPGLGGAELAKLARAKRPKLPIVLMSGYGQWQVAPGSFPEGVHKLDKPFTARRLMDTVRVALGD